MTRTVYVGSDRLERWVAGFTDRHGGATATRYDGRVELSAPDGASAVLHPVFGPLAGPADDPGQAATALVRDAGRVAVLRVLLVRRGGYACVVIDGDRVVSSKVGSRQVQARTAAGGWSQSRFARRRDGQRLALVDAVVQVAARVLLPGSAPGHALVTGGDRPLVDLVLGDPRLEPLLVLRRGPHLEIGAPGSQLVRELPRRARAVRIDLDEG